MRNIPFTQVHLTHGFWKHRQDLNRTVTVKRVYERFCDTGRFGAFALDWKEGMPNKPHYFWDSDVAKWLEGASYLLAERPDPELESIIERVVDRIEAGQDENGYFNIYFTVVAPQSRFSDRNCHELYCAGHLIEAACAYYQATGKDRFLRLMCRYADHIEDVFVKSKSASFYTPGHEEIELALVKLYETTKEERYLALAQHFIDLRGTVPEGGKDLFWGSDYPMYNQSHLPVRKQKTAEGHAVRGTYLYCGMSDLAFYTSDTELDTACTNLFENIKNKRMYVTGGIGSAFDGEAFTIDYDLPNLTAYSESCAAIGLVLFARRMQRLHTDASYAAVIERVLYNAFLSGTSLDGASFFYVNPLELRPELSERVHCLPKRLIRERFADPRRRAVFDCSCCPPNILRFVASLGDLLYTVDDENKVIYCQQYMASDAHFSLNGQDVSVTQETDYPFDGKIRLTYHGPDATLALRVPEWVSFDEGYRRYAVHDGDVIETEFPLSVRLIEADRRVQDAAGRYAVSRGPLLYCLEEADNGAFLRDVKLTKDPDFEVVFDEALRVPVLQANATRQSDGETLYRFRDENECRIPFRAKFIPYFTFANRSVGEMVLWVQAE